MKKLKFMPEGYQEGLVAKEKIHGFEALTIEKPGWVRRLAECVGYPKKRSVKSMTRRAEQGIGIVIEVHEEDPQKPTIQFF